MRSLLLALLLVTPNFLYSWELESSEDGIKVYSKDIPGNESCGLQGYQDYEPSHHQASSTNVDKDNERGKSGST